MHKKLQTIKEKVQVFLFGSRKRTIITGIGIVVVLFLLWKITSGSGTKVQYQTASVSRGTIISSVSETGNIATGSQGGVGSPTTGIVTDMYVKDGDQVAQGQNLFKVKSTATTQEISSAYSTYQTAVVSANTATQNKLTAQATLEKDRAAVITAQINVNTMVANIGGSKSNPSTGSPYTQNDIDSINSALTSARETFSADELKYKEEDQNIAAANASLNSAQLAYQATQDSIVTAPINGTVENISVRPGYEITASAGNLSSELSSSSTSNSSNSVLFIANSSSPYIKVQASEVDIPHIKEGQKATITLNAFNGQTFVGKVDQVDSVGTNSSGVITYNVFVSFIAPPDTIRPGMSATVAIQTDRKDNVLMVPIAAVQASNGTSTVQVLKNGQVTSVDVTTGISSDTDTEITSGLSEGDVVVIGAISTGSGSSTSPFSNTLRFGGGGGVLFRGGGGGTARGGTTRGQ